MTNKEYVAVNAIIKIKIRGASFSTFTFSKAEPEQRMFFGLLRKSKAIPAGYTNGRCEPTTAEAIVKEYPHLYYNGFNILLKPSVYLVLNNAEDEKIIFNTIEEADEFATNIIKKHNLSLEIIRES